MTYFSWYAALFSNGNACVLVWVRGGAFPRLVMGTSPKITNRIKSNRPGYESIRIESVIESKYYAVELKVFPIFKFFYFILITKNFCKKAFAPKSKSIFIYFFHNFKTFFTFFPIFE